MATQRESLWKTGIEKRMDRKRERKIEKARKKKRIRSRERTSFRHAAYVSHDTARVFEPCHGHTTGVPERERERQKETKRKRRNKRTAF